MRPDDESYDPPAYVHSPPGMHFVELRTEEQVASWCCVRWAGDMVDIGTRTVPRWCENTWVSRASVEHGGVGVVWQSLLTDRPTSITGPPLEPNKITEATQRRLAEIAGHTIPSGSEIIPRSRSLDLPEPGKWTSAAISASSPTNPQINLSCAAPRTSRQ